MEVYDNVGAFVDADRGRDCYEISRWHLSSSLNGYIIFLLSDLISKILYISYAQAQA